MPTEKSSWNRLIRAVAELKARGWSEEQLKSAVLDGIILTDSPEFEDKLKREREKGRNEERQRITNY